MIKKDVVIIGGGAAGLAAAVACREKGIEDILIIERESDLGGILKQCIHDGFGLIKFQHSYTGPEYAQNYIDQVEKQKIPYLLNSMVIDITGQKVLTVINKSGLKKYKAKSIILAMGCRERTRGAIGIPGTRPAGIYTAGVAQNLINMENIMVGKRVCILGSGDIGLIMARRVTLEGARVEAVFELLPYSSGLPRNIQQCLNDYDIPLFLSTTVTNIHGKDRLEGISVAQVDSDRCPIPETEKYIPCDTLLLSVGLIPENDLSIDTGISIDPRTQGALVDETFMTSIPGIFACGNVLHVHDLVDWVSLESAEAGAFAADHVKKINKTDASIPVCAGAGIGYTLPQSISGTRDLTLSMRVSAPSRDRTIVISDGDRKIKTERMARLHPAEMIRIDLKAHELVSCSRLEVSVL